MTQNLITSAFELVRDVEQGVLLLDTFHRLATREVLPPAPPAAPLLSLPASPVLPPVPTPFMPFPMSSAPLASGLLGSGLRGQLRTWSSRSHGKGAGPPGHVVRLLPFIRPSSEPTTRRRWISTCCSIPSWPW